MDLKERIESTIEFKGIRKARKIPWEKQDESSYNAIYSNLGDDKQRERRIIKSI